MGMFDWDPRYDIGVEAMNREHKVLLDLMAKLLATCEAKAAKPTILTALDHLARYTVHHFRQEEAYMEQIDYRDRRSHGLVHQNLLAKLDEHRKAFVNGRDPVLSTEFFQFLKLWLSSHILGIDMRYGPTAARRSA
jgi:hemerythrin